MTNLNSETAGEDVTIVERVSYNPTNFNYTNYNDISTCQIFIGEALTASQITTLQTSYPALNMQLDVQPLCFLQGTNILCFNADTKKDEYKPIETICNNDLVKTCKNGYKKVEVIGYSKIYNTCNDDLAGNKTKLYKCAKENYPELIDDLIIMELPIKTK